MNRSIDAKVANMARKVVLTSDISGDEDARTYEFSFDGVNYEIDLTVDEAKQFRLDLARYFDVARALGGVTAPKASLIGHTAAEVRAWAKAQGIDLPSRGRIPNEVTQSFVEAHGYRAS